ncbi:MAG: J domain-containing protein [Pseudorhodoplanes sp.]
MKFDSIFDKIRVKPADDRRLRQEGPSCEWPGCRAVATHRAPKGRGREGEQWRYCLDHVREYNQSYNYFAGMSEDAVLRYQKDAITGHRPTWKMGTGRHQVDENAQDPFGMFREFGGHGRGPREQARRPEESRTIRNAERKAFNVLGLETDASRIVIKARFHELVKRHHPDANQGDRSTEDRLVEVIQAYNYLKSVGFC